MQNPHDNPIIVVAETCQFVADPAEEEKKFEAPEPKRQKVSHQD
jgi:hypothetical protein